MENDIELGHMSLIARRVSGTHFNVFIYFFFIYSPGISFIVLVTILRDILTLFAVFIGAYAEQPGTKLQCANF